MPLHYLRFAVVLVLSVLTLHSVGAQVAIETPTPRDESTPESTPEPTKSSKSDATPQKPSKSLEETMRPEEFKAAGLDKLNEDELQHLDAYLQGYRQAAQKKASQQAKADAQDEIKKANEKAEKAEQASQEAKKEAASSRTKMDQLISRVNGNIDGIKGHTQIHLEDGSVWQQSNVDDHYRATVSDHPAAVVSHTWLGYKMQIEGMPEFYVDPIRPPQ